MGEKTVEMTAYERLLELQELNRVWIRWRVALFGGTALAALLGVVALVAGSLPVARVAAIAGAGAVISWLRSRGVMRRARRLRDEWGQEGSTEEPAPPKHEPRTYRGQLTSPTPAGPVGTSSVAVTVLLGDARSCRTADGGSFTVGPGPTDVRFRMTLDERRPPDGEAFVRDFVVTDTWVTDAAGVEWHTRTHLDPWAFTKPLTPDGLPASRGEVRFWTEAPERWQRTLAEGCLVSGVRDLIDSRERFQLPVGEHDEVTVMLKYQGPVVDVAWLDDEAKLLVRAAGMYYEIREDGRYVEGVDQVCFGYRLDPATILPFVSSELHWPEWEEWFESDEPKPPRFERV